MGSRIEITWLAFLLRAEPKTGDRDKFREYTKSWLNPAEQEPDTRFTVWASQEDQPSSSIPAHVAHKAVSLVASERTMDFHHRLLRAYFTENRNIADSEVLLELVQDIRVDRDAVAEVATTRRDELTQAVIDEHNLAQQNQVTAVPTVMFEGTFPVPGAQPVESYRRIIQRIEEHKAAQATD